MPLCRAVIEIAAPPDLVFTYLYDPEKLRRWVSGLVETRAADGEPRLGSRATAVFEVRGRGHEIESETTRVESGRVLEGLTKTRKFDSFGVQELEDLGGRTRLTITCRYVYHSLPLKMLALPIEWYARRRIRRDLGRLKEIVEADKA